MKQEWPDGGLLGNSGRRSEERMAPVGIGSDKHVGLPGRSCIAWLGEGVPLRDALQAGQQGLARPKPANEQLRSECHSTLEICGRVAWEACQNV